MFQTKLVSNPRQNSKPQPQIMECWVTPE